MTKLFRPISILLLFAIGVTACNSQATTTYETISAAAITVGDPIPEPTGAAILTLSGEIGNPNSGDELVFDLATLETLGLVQYTVADPWLNQDISYTGVLLADLLKYAQASDTVEILTVTAFDGYAADLPFSEVDTYPVLVATQANDVHLTIENNGPTRIIFPYARHKDLTEARGMSVWNVALIEVK